MKTPKINIQKIDKHLKQLDKKILSNCKSQSEVFIPILTKGEKNKISPRKNAIESAVIILILEVEGIPSIVFIERAEDNGVHSGQIAFPGGRFDIENGDKTHIDTAIRETHEEIGVKIEQGNIIHKLDSIYIVPSNYNVHPFIASYNGEIKFKANISEVKRVITIPIEYFLKGNCTQRAHFKTKYGLIEAPCFVWDEIKIWGATAILLMEYICILKAIEKNIYR